MTLGITIQAIIDRCVSNATLDARHVIRGLRSVSDFTAATAHTSGEYIAELTEAGYEKRIPAWCGARTIAEHIDMLLCWSLVRYAERQEDKPERTCMGCCLYEPRT